MKDNNDQKDFNEFVAKYGGATIGAIVALVLCFSQLYKLLVCIVIVLVGILVGN